MAFVFALTVSSIGAVPFCMYAAGRKVQQNQIASGVFIGGFVSMFGPIGWMVAASMLEDAGNTEFANLRYRHYKQIKSDKRHAKYVARKQREEEYRVLEEQREIDIQKWIKTNPGQCFDCGYVWCQCGDFDR